MCDPVTLAVTSLAVGTVSAGVSFIAQSQAASRQSAMARANAAAAEQSNRQKQAQIASDFWNKRGSMVEEQAQRQQQADAAAARARVSAGEGGVSGGVLDSLLLGVQSQAGTNLAIAQRNVDVLASDTENARINANAEMMDRVRSVPLGVTPSILSPILQVANSGINSMFMFNQLNSQPKVQTYPKGG